MIPRRRCLRPLSICLLLFSTATGLAQDLTLAVKGANPRFRSQAPIPIDLTLNWNSSDLIEGTLRLEFRDSGSLLLKYENPDIAMAFGDFAMRIVIPPLANETDSVEVNASFVSAEWGSYDLGQHTLKVPADWKRQLLIGLITPDGETSAMKVFDYLDRISLDQYRPADGGVNVAKPKDQMDVINVRFSSKDAPTRAAPLCAYDVIVLAADAARELRDRQKKSLLAWVDAGGSVLVDASGSISPMECNFLNELACRTPGENEFIPDANDRLRSQDRLILARRGFGRVVVTTAGPAQFSDAEAFEATCWLWKVRNRTREAISQQGRWKTLPVRTRSSPIDFPKAEELGYDPATIEKLEMVIPPYAPNPLRSGTQLPTSLLPDSVETVPLPIVMAVLGLFLLVIAPGDWFLFGWLKKRMLTWVFFPAMCLLFTGVMVFLANQYIGQEDYRTAIRFIDWGSADRVSRVTDVETLFSSTAEPVVTKLSDQLFAAVDTNGTIDWQASAASENQPLGYINMTRLDEGLDAPTPTMTGRPTTQYSVRLPIGKWTPTVSRLTSFGTEPEELPPVDWLTVNASDVQSDPEGTVVKLREANPEAAVVIVRGERQTKPRVVDERTGDFTRLAIEASIQKAEGFFSVVSALSPNGHGSLEDVAVLDTTNSEDALILIVFGRQNDVIVHRRMFYAPEMKTQ